MVAYAHCSEGSLTAAFAAATRRLGTQGVRALTWLCPSPERSEPEDPDECPHVNVARWRDRNADEAAALVERWSPPIGTKGTAWAQLDFDFSPGDTGEVSLGVWTRDAPSPTHALRLLTDDLLGVDAPAAAEEVEALLTAFAGPPGHPASLVWSVLCEGMLERKQPRGEDREATPFDALAVLHSRAEDAARDFALGWLEAQQIRDTLEISSWPTARVCDFVEHRVRELAPRLRGGFDGSLQRADVVGLLQMPASRLLAALEEAAAPSTADGPWVRRVPGGGVLLGAPRGATLWPLYRAAADLLGFAR